MYWLGAAGDVNDAGPGTDFEAVAQGFVSVTPLSIDMTRRDRVEGVADWLGGLA